MHASKVYIPKKIALFLRNCYVISWTPTPPIVQIVSLKCMYLVSAGGVHLITNIFPKKGSSFLAYILLKQARVRVHASHSFLITHFDCTHGWLEGQPFLQPKAFDLGYPCFLFGYIIQRYVMVNVDGQSWWSMSMAKVNANGFACSLGENL